MEHDVRHCWTKGCSCEEVVGFVALLVDNLGDAKEAREEWLMERGKCSANCVASESVGCRRWGVVRAEWSEGF